MAAPEDTLSSVRHLLDQFQTKLNNRKGELSYYDLAENLLIKILNEIFECSIVNANKNNKNRPAIDLIDRTKKISIQVTADTSLDKIKETIDKIKEYEIDSVCDRLYFVMLYPKQKTYSKDAIDKCLTGTNIKFSWQQDILDISDLSFRMKFLTSTPQKLVEIERHLKLLINQSYYKKKFPNNSIEEFIHKKYINQKDIDFVFDPSTLDKYSDLFKMLASFEGGVESYLSFSQNIFEVCAQHIYLSESQHPLVVNGLAGSGKSTFLSVLYKAMASNYKHGSYLPIYINVQTYLHIPLENAIEQLANDINHIKKLISPSDNIILIIDGHDDSFRSVIYNAKELIAKVYELLDCQKKVVGVNTHDRAFLPQLEESFFDDLDSKITLKNISAHDDSFKTFIRLYSKVKVREQQVQDGDYEARVNEIEGYLLAKIKAFKITRIDFFVLFILHEKKNSISYKSCASLSDYYKLYCSEKMHASEKEKLVELSTLAFDFYIKNAVPNGADSENWKIIHTHNSIRDYLIAYQIIHRLIKFSKADNNSIADYSSLNFVYTDIINNFCKEIMNGNQNTEKEVYDAIVKIFERTNLTAKTHFCYLFGRFKQQPLIESAKNFLQTKLSQIQATKYDLKDKNSSQNLLFIRTIHISLIYLGDKNINETYLKLVINNAKWDIINRGFHREYYGDILYEPGMESLTYEDNVEEGFSNTFNKLYLKINDCLDEDKPAYYNLFEVELYTLCSLAQHRQVAGNHGKVTPKQIEQLAILTGKVLNQKRLRSSTLKKYIYFIHDVFYEHNKRISLGYFLNQLYNIKNEDRLGWVKRGIKNPEKVSSHTYGAYLLGRICLPTVIDGYNNYNKSTVLDMILIHDLAEAIIGDATPDMIDEAHKKREKNTFEKIGLLGTYFHNDVANIEIIWRNFEIAKEYSAVSDDNINAIIANDLDKLDNLHQLYIYRDNIDNAVFFEWKNDLIDNLRSDEGIKIKDIIVDYFENLLP